MTPEALIEISKLLHTQDNRITDQPMFVVQRKVRDYGYDSEHSDDYEWLDTVSGDYNSADEHQTRILDKADKRRRDIKGWVKAYYRDRWEFVTACFTEKGCEDYIKRDGHNLGETRIYAEGSYRNNEYQVVRNFLMSLTEAKNAR